MRGKADAPAKARGTEGEWEMAKARRLGGCWILNPCRERSSAGCFKKKKKELGGRSRLDRRCVWPAELQKNGRWEWPFCRVYQHTVHLAAGWSAGGWQEGSLEATGWRADQQPCGTVAAVETNDRFNACIRCLIYKNRRQVQLLCYCRDPVPRTCTDERWIFGVCLMIKSIR